MEKGRRLNTLTMLGFVFYFFVLFAERLIALILSINQGGELALVSPSFIGIATYAVTAGFFLVGLAYFIPCLIKMGKAMKEKRRFEFEGEEGKKTIRASMLFLFTGMMHTGWTLAALQFVAYGFLILSMIFQVADLILQKKTAKLDGICSLIYLISFSMAIPVCYANHLELGLAIPYYVAEFAAVTILIPFFGLSLYSLFEKGKDRFSILMVLAMAVLDVTIIATKWAEEINFFLLIFASLSVVLFIVFFPLLRKKEKPQNEQN